MGLGGVSSTAVPTWRTAAEKGKQGGWPWRAEHPGEHHHHEWPDSTAQGERALSL